MMRALAGSSLKVTGSSSATVSAGPMPGSTPTAVPMVTPTKAHSRLAGVSASPKPCSSEPSWSTSEPPRSDGQSQPDQFVEDQEDHPGQGPAVRRDPGRVGRAEQQ